MAASTSTRTPKRKRDDDEAVRTGMLAVLQESSLLLPSDYDNEIIKHRAMAEAVRNELLLRQGHARNALDDLRMHITTHATLEDRKKQASGVIHNTGWDNRLARKRAAIDDAASRYRKLRDTLIVLGMQEGDEEFRPLADEDKRAFVIISEEQLLGDSRRKPSWIWGDFSFVGKADDGTLKTFMFESEVSLCTLCGQRPDILVRSARALVPVQCASHALVGRSGNGTRRDVPRC